MFKLVVLSALLAVVAAAPGLYTAPLAYSAAVVGSVPTSVSHQSRGSPQRALTLHCPHRSLLLAPSVSAYSAPVVSLTLLHSSCPCCSNRSRSAVGFMVTTVFTELRHRQHRPQTINMFKLVVLSALLAVVAAAPGFTPLHWLTMLLLLEAYQLPSAIKEQRSPQRALSLYAPVVHSAPVVSAYSAPVVSAYSAPVLSAYSAPVVAAHSAQIVGAPAVGYHGVHGTVVTKLDYDE
ncbi:PREDICTED: cuticle protein LPCP-23-like [Nicrophorus vespilloides]|uniref:Cuticle protein LPCP-23-like n=1 Tax=Nicrophorus vespilloides TaxID=110193 RepID=A0ABM1MFB6_NICVS|nr:PREDICTED: cuticle protein LPCP-23-like [Nicrophorus vespilloides]